MIYLVSGQKSLFESDLYEEISVEQSLEILNKWDIVQFDTETSGRDSHICKILCIQFGNKSANIQIVVDTTTINILNYKNILESKLLVGQNLKFDLQFLYNYGITPIKVWDTMVIEQFLHLGYDNKYFHYSLKAIADRRLGIDIDKTTRGEIIWRGLDTKVIQYAAGDVVYLEDIKEQQEKEVAEQNGILGAQIENNFVPVIAYLEWCGIRLDENKWKLKMQDNERKRINALEALNKFCVDYCLNNEEPIPIEEWVLISEKKGENKILYEIDKKYKKFVKTNEIRYYEDNYGMISTYQKYKLPITFIQTPIYQDLFSEFDPTPQCIVNWSSAAQVIPFVKYLGFDVKVTDKKTGEEKESVVEKQLTKQKGINNEFLELYFAYQEATKECSTYGQNYLNAINPITGRIHTQFKQIGAISGRMSCGSRQSNTDLAKLKNISPSKCGYPQIQNLPSDEITRSSFIPNKGNLMTSCDYAALESRLGADIYQDEAMLKEYLEGSGDIHSLVAKACFPKELEGIPVSEVKSKRPDLRKKAKAPEFACQFEISNFLF